MKNFIKNKNKSKTSGFTIIETLVALSIFCFSILALLVVTSQGAASTTFTKNKLSASYLAQEGIEMIRNMRDGASLSAKPWIDSFHNNVLFELSKCYPNPLSQLAGCDIDSQTLTIFQCPLADGSCGNLRYDSSSGFFRSGSFASISLPDSGFNRVITLRDLGTGNNEVEVTSVVSWIQGGQNKSVALIEDLFDWATISTQ